GCRLGWPISFGRRVVSRRSETGSSRTSPPSGRTRSAGKVSHRRTSTSCGPASSRTPCGAAARRARGNGQPKHGVTRRRKSSHAFGERSRPRSVSAARAAALRRLPAGDELLRRLADQEEVRGRTRARLTALVREALEQERTRVLEERAAPAATETTGALLLERLADERG